MPHREIRDDERCQWSPLVGVHVWEWIDATTVQCMFCREKPDGAREARLIEERRRSQEAERIAARLKNSQAIGTGRKRA